LSSIDISGGARINQKNNQKFPASRGHDTRTFFRGGRW